MNISIFYQLLTSKEVSEKIKRYFDLLTTYFEIYVS